MTSAAIHSTPIVLALQAHAPYIRQPGRSAVGEEPLHELIISTYAPMLAGLYELIDQNIAVRLGLAISPILLEQLADPVVQKHTLQTLELLTQRASADVERWEQQGNAHAAYLARFYVQLYTRTQHTFERQFGRNLVAATRILAEAGHIEVIASTATNIPLHSYGPATVRTQLETGLIATLRHLGQRPTSVWAVDDPLPTHLLNILPELGLRGVLGAPDETHPLLPPCWLDSTRRVWALPPNKTFLNHIRSLSLGYPSDIIYRSQRRDDQSHERYWRLANDLGQANQRMWYDPFYAYARARLHAQHFVSVLEQTCALMETDGQRSPLVITADMELFGHGWFEGGIWIRSLIEAIHEHPQLQLVLPHEAISAYPPTQVIPPHAGSAYMVDGHLRAAAQQLREQVKRFPDAWGERERCLNQAARELLLAQSGDWLRLQSLPTAGYARARQQTHLARLERLLALAQQTTLDAQQRRELAEVEEADNPFPFLNYRLFGATGS